MSKDTPRTDNDFILGSNGSQVGSMLPLVINSRQQAYRTAAWIKLMAVTLPNEDIASSYDEVEDAIANT